MSDENEEATSEPTIREELAGDLVAYFGEPYTLESDPGPVIMRQQAQANDQVLTTVGLNEDVWSNPTPARCAQLAARTLVRMAEDDAFDTEVAVDGETHELRYRTTVKDDPEIWEKYVQPFHPIIFCRVSTMACRCYGVIAVTCPSTATSNTRICSSSLRATGSEGSSTRSTGVRSKQVTTSAPAHPLLRHQGRQG